MQSDLIQLLVGEVTFIVIFVTLGILVEGCLSRMMSHHDAPPLDAAAITTSYVVVDTEERLRIIQGVGLVLAVEGEPEDCCSICLQEYEAKEEIRVLPNCTHGFHVNCVDRWLLLHSSCPLCRGRIRALL
ncbi:uncharacterized protein A4U43_UnF12040 [Asparagus officinalis]|uniref:RING-type domain-containing protein n=1 Tax=Asparagus officinalis TaxID=4686 RepID=A0A1R3L554_ASPOF|nr:uncharacterized protein A4U43_UnF12040 [Asparagus officinalis]